MGIKYRIIREKDLLYHCSIQLNNGKFIDTQWVNRSDAVNWVVHICTTNYVVVTKNDVFNSIKYEDGYKYNLGFWWGDLLRLPFIFFMFLIPLCILLCYLKTQ